MRWAPHVRSRAISVFIFLVCLALIIALPIVAAYLLWLWLSRRWHAAGSEQPVRRTAIVLAGLLAICSPYLAFKTFDLWFALSRIPPPLHVAWIEYRLEEAWGFGPGGNETGFVVYRLTQASAKWARARGEDLPAAIHSDFGPWRPTPVQDRGDDGRWHRRDGKGSYRGFHNASISEYLEQYIPISVPAEAIAEANAAIREPGSYYAYKPGGGVMIVDPARGKVYYAYAG